MNLLDGMTKQWVITIMTFEGENEHDVNAAAGSSLRYIYLKCPKQKLPFM